jgi:2-succinyl-6-hydroxy-2,4-cyclohexadiene-1-carboxylate synthase
MDLTINGILYHLEKHQKDTKKPDILLLHGFMGSGESFKSTLPFLKEYVNPVTVDLLGHGKTESANSAKRFTLDCQIVDIKRLIEKVFETKPFLYGYSMGGRLALRYALTFPHTICGLVLESATYGLNDQETIRERKQMDEERAQAIENGFSSFLDKWQKLPLFQSNLPTDEERTETYQAIQQQQDPQQMANSLRGFGTAQMPSVKGELSTLHLPVLLLAGKADLKYVEIMENMHRELPISELYIAPDAGHRVHLENPESLAAVIKKFIEYVLHSYSYSSDDLESSDE